MHDKSGELKLQRKLSSSINTIKMDRKKRETTLALHIRLEGRQREEECRRIVLQLVGLGDIL